MPYGHNWLGMGANAQWHEPNQAYIEAKSKIAGATGEYGDDSLDDLQYSYAGRMANTANLSAQATAERMEYQGKEAEDIRKETGWFRGMDGKWRFEISDRASELLERPKVELHREDNGDVYYTGTLEGILKHDDLFEAYPNLRSCEVIIQTTEEGVLGSAFAEDNQIVLKQELFRRKKNDASRKAESPKLRTARNTRNTTRPLKKTTASRTKRGWSAQGRLRRSSSHWNRQTV